MSAEFTGVTPGAEFPPYNSGPLTSAYASFVMSETPVAVPDMAVDGYALAGHSESRRTVPLVGLLMMRWR